MVTTAKYHIKVAKTPLTTSVLGRKATGCSLFLDGCSHIQNGSGLKQGQVKGSLPGFGPAAFGLSAFCSFLAAQQLSTQQHVDLSQQTVFTAIGL